MSLSAQHKYNNSMAPDNRTETSSLFLKILEPGLAREARQIKEFMAVDLAHSVMLTEQGILSEHDGALLIRALLTLRNNIETLDFSDMNRGSLLFHIEHWLSEQIGEELSGRLHTGRSRIDQGTTVRRLYKRNHLLLIMQKMIEMRSIILSLAEKHKDTLMPGYTHMQHAQPWIFGHYLLSYADRLDDDFERMIQSYRFTNISPLGSAGLVGTSWPLDRRRTASLLGFDAIVENARLARDATYAADCLASMSFIMSTLNDIATDLHVWSSFEFGMVELPYDLCGTSSIFPQKKNPEALEAIRYAAGGATTWLGSALATFRGEGSGDQAMRELPMFDNAAMQTSDMLALSCDVLSRLVIHEERMNSHLMGSWATASNLADQLVKACALSFRQAHHVVAYLVAHAIRNGIKPDQIGEHELCQAAQNVLGRDVTLSSETIKEALSPRLFVNTRITDGGVAPQRIQELSANAHGRLAEHKQLLVQLQSRIGNAYQRLEQEANKIAGTTGNDISKLS